MKRLKTSETCCPYCTGDVSQLRVGEDDSIDFCKTCDVVIEGETVIKLIKGVQNEDFNL